MHRTTFPLSSSNAPYIRHRMGESKQNLLDIRQAWHMPRIYTWIHIIVAGKAVNCEVLLLRLSKAAFADIPSTDLSYIHIKRWLIAGITNLYRKLVQCINKRVHFVTSIVVKRFCSWLFL